MEKTKRQKYEVIRSQLTLERASFLPLWRELAEYILPSRPQFLVSDTNKGDRRNTRIIDSTATQCADVLKAGISSGVTSPARDWKRLSTPNPQTMESGDVKAWLDQVNDDMSTIFLRSNLYNALPVVYGDLPVFATTAMMVEEDFENVIHSTVFPVGSFMVGVDSKGKVNIFMREFRMTVRQLIEKFGEMDGNGDVTNWKNFSLHVKHLWEDGQKEAWIEVCHIICPNDEYDDSRLSAKYKKYASCYYERGSSETSANYMEREDTYLRESGYDLFPILLVRWEVKGQDTYGTNCPGIKARGDIKQLQLGEKRIMQAIEKMINPAMVGDPSLRTAKTSILPGDVTWVAEVDGNAKFRPAYQIDPRINEMEAKQEQIRERIKSVFHTNAILSFLNDERSQPRTKAEVDQIAQEKLTVFGPILEQLNCDLLDPLIDLTFEIMVRQGRVPEPPQELQGVELKVEYISIMAQAQKLVGVSGVERCVKFGLDVFSITQNPADLDKIDFDQTMDVYGDLTSVPAGVIRTDEAVQEMRQSRAEAQKQQQEAEHLAMAAKGAKDLAGADLEKPSLLKQLVKPEPVAA